MLLTCGALLTEARDTSGNAGPRNVSFGLFRCLSSQYKIFSCICHLTHGYLRLFLAFAECGLQLIVNAPRFATGNSR